MKPFLQKIAGWYKRRRKIGKIGLISLAVLLALLFFTSSIARWYINANGEDLSGRKLHLSDLSINYLTFSVTADDFVMYEANKKDTFVYLGNLYANMNPWALFSGEYDLSAVELDRLNVQIIRSDSGFNFDDLQSDEQADTTAESAHFYLNNVKLTNSSIRYVDSTINTTYPIHKLSVTVPKYAWNGEETSAQINFSLGNSGRVDIAAGLNNSEQSYSVDFKTSNIDLAYGESYLKDMFNIQSTTGFLHTDLSIDGSLENTMAIFVKGTTAISKLDIIDKRGNPFSKIDSVGMTIDSMNLAQNYFSISETTLRHPVAYSTIGTNTSNIDYVLEPVLTPSTTPDTVVKQSASTEETPFHFSIAKAVIQQGEVHYTDHTLDRPFHYTLSGLNITTTNIAENSRNLTSVFSVITNGKGRIQGTSTFDIVSPNNMKLDVDIRDVDLLSFSPFSEYYVASPIMQGTFNYDLDLSMTSTHLENHNAFDIRELEFGKKIESDSAYKVPIKLAMILLKDKNDNIQFEIPITGNPSDPDFKLMPIVWQTLKKFIVKAASKPMSAVSSIAGNNPEDADKLVFAFGRNYLDDKQKKELDNIVEFHTKKPELAFAFVQMTNTTLEKQEMAIVEAKKRFNPNNWRDVSNNDDSFIAFLQEKTGGSNFEEMCVKLIGAGSLETKMAALLSERNELVKTYLSDKSMPARAYSVQTADLKNLASQVKKPMFKIEVSVE